MLYQRVWAQIDGDGTVQNRMVCDDYETANYVTRCTYGEDAVAVEVTNWAVTEGCAYRSGKFYHEDGTACDYLPDVEERVKAAQSQADETSETVNAILTDVIPAMLGGNA